MIVAACDVIVLRFLSSDCPWLYLEIPKGVFKLFSHVAMCLSFALTLACPYLLSLPAVKNPRFPNLTKNSAGGHATKREGASPSPLCLKLSSDARINFSLCHQLPSEVLLVSSYFSIVDLRLTQRTGGITILSFSILQLTLPLSHTCSHPILHSHLQKNKNKIKHPHIVMKIVYHWTWVKVCRGWV